MQIHEKQRSYAIVFPRFRRKNEIATTRKIPGNISRSNNVSPLAAEKYTRPQRRLNEFIKLPEERQSLISIFHPRSAHPFDMLMQGDGSEDPSKTLITVRPTFRKRSSTRIFSRNFSTVRRTIQPAKSKFTYLCTWRMQGRLLNGKADPRNLSDIRWNP